MICSLFSRNFSIKTITVVYNKFKPATNKWTVHKIIFFLPNMKNQIFGLIFVHWVTSRRQCWVGVSVDLELTNEVNEAFFFNPFTDEQLNFACQRAKTSLPF